MGGKACPKLAAGAAAGPLQNLIPASRVLEPEAQGYVHFRNEAHDGEGFGQATQTLRERRMKPLLLAAIPLALAAASSTVQAHSWYSEKKDPVFKHSCCGGTDCAQLVITRTAFSAEENGYRIRLTLEETRKINPYSMAPINAVVTWDRVQPSEDGNWHICIMTHHRDNVRGGIYCLFTPPNI